MAPTIVVRWFGPKDDHVPLQWIRQVPGVEGVVSALFDIPVGEVWPKGRIEELKSLICSHGLSFEVVESVNVHEDIKLGLPSRDRYIENYILTLRNLASVGVKVVCYNFMPVFDWIRTDLAYTLDDGSSTMAYDRRLLEGKGVEDLVSAMFGQSKGFSLPGWEPERLAAVRSTIEQYRAMGEDELFDNLRYFLSAVVPECERLGIRMAIHPDDPPWGVFGLPRIVTTEENIMRILALVDSPANSCALCTGSLAARSDNDVARIIRRVGERGRLAFVHLRNLKKQGEGIFYESAHPSFCGSLDMYELVAALHGIGFDGYLRPDHGRHIWGEEGRPGYGFYDRALGIAYILGLWEGIEKSASR
ncbi:Mannonate dehydratase [Spirochaeta thermophila DSM 6578]|uniref:Mannonate dehydratase n=1 Tax=Winmispira thermophila (strain ATCC 700085 / DSM 6578 / Z-1203) TaxID=869211 RepID=G0G9W0_WINT7|nr:mannonate dehydratase [Spirochaeta thermophila]AEJ60860.1 Mannonate dehydratase [Spirochaeta thermophila DSM 6578]